MAENTETVPTKEKVSFFLFYFCWDLRLCIESGRANKYNNRINYSRAEDKDVS